MSTFKLAFIGDCGVGKTTFLNRHLTGNFKTDYVKTIGTVVKPLTLKTNRGKVTLDVWDISGQEMGQEYLKGTDAAIIFFDATNKQSYKSASNWLQMLKHVSPNAKYVLVGNKVDDYKNIEVKMNKSKPSFYYISSKSNYNYDLPFEVLLRQLLEDEGVRIRV